MKLEKYEEKCPSCNGGKRKQPLIAYIATWWFCEFCKGSGKISWIDKLKFESELNKINEIRKEFIKSCNFKDEEKKISEICIYS